MKFKNSGIRRYSQFEGTQFAAALKKRPPTLDAVVVFVSYLDTEI